MTIESIYEVSFVGQDFQPISKAAETIKIKLNGKDCYIADSIIKLKEESQNDSDKTNEYARYILDCFLEKIAPNGSLSDNTIIINPSQRNNRKKLYDPNFVSEEDKGYFGGLVGVIRDSINLKLSELKNSIDDELAEENLSNEVKLNVTLQIKSRLDVNGEKKVSKPFFLSTMLLRDKVKLRNNTVPSSEDEIFDYLLLVWFREKLQEASLKGYYKTYRRFEKNDDKVRGTLDITRHIRMNMGQKNGRIAYSYRENTINNYFNQLIVAAYQHLKNKYYDLVVDNFDNNIELKNMINFLSEETNYVQTNAQAIIKENLKTIAHPYFTEYEELRLICLRILRDQGISIFDGISGNDTQGILFYLPELWEKFLEDKVFKIALSNGIKLEAQAAVYNFGHLKLNGDGYNYEQITYPDYVFFHEGKPFMILDAKFKPKWENAANGKSVRDVMEDYNKCIRDMVAVNSHATGVIFPTNEDIELKSRILIHPISKYNSWDIFYTIPVTVPYVNQDDRYSDWNSSFDKKIQKIITIIKNILEKEVNFNSPNNNEDDRFLLTEKFESGLVTLSANR